MTHIAVQPDVKQLVEQELSLGGYSSESELVREALTMLAERRQTIAGIERGLDDVKHGRVISLEEFDAQLRERFNFEEIEEETEA